jgi:hypothetical protein
MGAVSRLCEARQACRIQMFASIIGVWIPSRRESIAVRDSTDNSRPLDTAIRVRQSQIAALGGAG